MANDRLWLVHPKSGCQVLIAKGWGGAFEAWPGDGSRLDAFFQHLWLQYPESMTELVVETEDHPNQLGAAKRILSEPDGQGGRRYPEREGDEK